MTLRKGHGTGAGEPRIEVLPPNELPAPLPAPPDPVARRRNGTVDGSEAAKLLGARGGAAKASRARLVSSLGLTKLAADSAFAAYRDAGDQFVTQHLAELARVSGGEVGPGPASIVTSAAVQLAASRFWSDRAAAACDPSLWALASSLANASRQNLLAAYELGVREGEARSKAAKSPALAPWFKDGGK